MDDFEKNRVEYVNRLEVQLQHLQRQLAEAVPNAEKWTPIVATELTGTEARVTLGFGGKRVTATFPSSALLNGDPTGITSSVVDTLCESLIVEQLRTVVRPEIEKLVRNASSISGAGTW